MGVGYSPYAAVLIASPAGSATSSRRRRQYNSQPRVEIRAWGRSPRSCCASGAPKALGSFDRRRTEPDLEHEPPMIGVTLRLGYDMLAVRRSYLAVPTLPGPHNGIARRPAGGFARRCPRWLCRAPPARGHSPISPDREMYAASECPKGRLHDAAGRGLGPGSPVYCTGNPS
jgi:hypothetical protein